MDTSPKPFNPNRHLKEQFVSNLTGTSMLEIFALSTTFPILTLLRHLFSSTDVSDEQKKKDDDAVAKPRNLRTYMAALTVDFITIIMPMFSIVVVSADQIIISSIFFAIFIVLYILAKRSCASTISKEAEQNSLRAHISSLRVLVTLIACLCILAVDFKIFPRRLAKTETYGISLMDLGVGSFVLVNSFVSREARNITSMKWMTLFQSTSPLILLGFGRLITTESVDYQVHVGEYGVHWNFFFTLASVALLTSLVRIPPQYCGIFGLLILVGYQYYLNSGLNVYLLSEERGTDLISQNKEGLFSIFGYWGMYLVGVRLGNYLFFESQSSTLRSVRWARIRVWILTLISWLLTVILDKYVERVSRRTCNLAYVTYVVADNLQILSILMLGDFIPGSKISVLEEAFSQNLLATFLLANILTGVINLSVNTISSSSASAICILIFYAYTLASVMGLADFYKLKLKFW